MTQRHRDAQRLIWFDMLEKCVVLAALVFCAGCGGSSNGDAGSDDGGPDSGRTDAGLDAGSDSGVPDSGMNDAGMNDAGSMDSGTDAGPGDAGTMDAGTDAGTDSGVADSGFDGGVDAGTDGGPSFDGGIWDGGPQSAIRFGGHPANDGIFTYQHVDPDLRTVAGWFKLRIDVPMSPRPSNGTSQECIWSLEDNPPSSAYQLMVNTFHMDQWESHDRAQGGFLFAPVDLGWWFIAESNRAAGPATTLYWMKLGSTTLNVATGNNHPAWSGATRFLIGTDDATGQNEWFDGDAAGVKIWNAELTKTELETEATQLSPVRTANLWAFYPLQSVATMMQDFSGNGRDLQPIVPDAGLWTEQTGPTIPY